MNMKLIEDRIDRKPNYIIFTGNGRTELQVLRALPEKYDGHELILFFPFPPRSEKKGLAALDVIKDYLFYGYNSFIFILDGDTFKGRPADEDIKDYLTGISIEIIDINQIHEAFLINCKSGNQEIVLYCIISGPQTFIEEEIVNLIKLTLKIEIDLSGERDNNWKRRIKKDVKRILRENRTNYEQLIRRTGTRKLEIAFPNLCSVFKKIEEDFMRNNP